jgi:hypothetical protein
MSSGNRSRQAVPAPSFFCQEFAGIGVTIHGAIWMQWTAHHWALEAQFLLGSDDENRIIPSVPA